VTSSSSDGTQAGFSSNNHCRVNHDGNIVDEKTREAIVDADRGLAAIGDDEER